MTSSAIGKLIQGYLDDLQGEEGFWRGMRDDVQVFVLSDETHDRMRIMAPIGELKDVEASVLQLLLEANYDRALDAKYAMRGTEVWSVCVHPLATLAPDDFGAFLDQVVSLVKNTGTTYASSDLVFGAGRTDPAASAVAGDGEDEEDDDEASGGDDEDGDGDDDDDGGLRRP